MYSLFSVKFNYFLFFGLAILFLLVFPTLKWYMYIAIFISLHQFMLLFKSIGSILPIRYLLGAFMCLQMYIGPTLAYSGLDEFQRGYLKMQIPSDQYFLYVLPAVALFILGLHFGAGKLDGEVLDIDSLKKFVERNKRLPYIFIIIGFSSSVLAIYFGAVFTFVFTLLSNFKFIGAFFLIIGQKKIPPLTLLIVFGSIVSSSLQNAMFHDLIVWTIFLGAILAIRFKPSSNFKLVITFGFLIIVAFIQIIKGEYRTATWNQGEEGGIETLTKSYEVGEEKEGGFSYENLAKSNVRINQGFIITNILNTVPEKVPFEYGKEMLLILESALLPRILAPNKLNAGDRFIFMKYSGIPLAKGTSMGLSSLGDAYINFGMFGGALFMFFYGLFFNKVLLAFKKYSHYYPALLVFTPFVFYYPIRPDCELQTILGHLVKSCFLIFLIFQIWKVKFKRVPGLIMSSAGPSSKPLL